MHGDVLHGDVLVVSSACPSLQLVAELSSSALRQVVGGSRANTIINFVPQQQAWVVERFGKFLKTLQPVSSEHRSQHCRASSVLIPYQGLSSVFIPYQGLNILIPVVDQIRYVQSLKETVVDIPSQSAITEGEVWLQQGGGYSRGGLQQGGGYSRGGSGYSRGLQQGVTVGGYSSWFLPVAIALYLPLHRQCDSASGWCALLPRDRALPRESALCHAHHSQCTGDLLMTSSLILTGIVWSGERRVCSSAAGSDHHASRTRYSIPPFHHSCTVTLTVN